MKKTNVTTVTAETINIKHIVQLIKATSLYDSTTILVFDPNKLNAGRRSVMLKNIANNISMDKEEVIDTMLTYPKMIVMQDSEVENTVVIFTKDVDSNLVKILGNVGTMVINNKC